MDLQTERVATGCSAPHCTVKSAKKCTLDNAMHITLCSTKYGN